LPWAPPPENGRGGSRGNWRRSWTWTEIPPGHRVRKSRLSGQRTEGFHAKVPSSTPTRHSPPFVPPFHLPVPHPTSPLTPFFPPRPPHSSSTPGSKLFGYLPICLHMHLGHAFAASAGFAGRTVYGCNGTIPRVTVPAAGRGSEGAWDIVGRRPWAMRKCGALIGAIGSAHAEKSRPALSQPAEFPTAAAVTYGKLAGRGGRG